MELLVTIIILALIFDYINGFHDAANSIATIVSTRVLTPFQAVIWAAPAKPPIRVCEEEDGIPFHQVTRFQVIAAITPANIMGRVIYCSTTVLDTVLAIPNPPIIYLAMKKATKLKKATSQPPLAINPIMSPRFFSNGSGLCCDWR